MAANAIQGHRSHLSAALRLLSEQARGQAPSSSRNQKRSSSGSGPMPLLTESAQRSIQNLAVLIAATNSNSSILSSSPPVSPSFSSFTSSCIDETAEIRARQRSKIRITNRTRQRRWREEHKSENKDRDLRVRVRRRADALFGKESTSPEKAQWIESEFQKRRQKRIDRERLRQEEEKEVSDTPETQMCIDNQTIQQVSQMSASSTISHSHLRHQSPAPSETFSFRSMSPATFSSRPIAPEAIAANPTLLSTFGSFNHPIALQAALRAAQSYVRRERAYK